MTKVAKREGGSCASWAKREKKSSVREGRVPCALGKEKK